MKNKKYSKKGIVIKKILWYYQYKVKQKRVEEESKFRMSLTESFGS